MKQARSDMFQTAVRLPREMHERLKQSEHGLSEEIRRRVERSFEEEAYDVKTRELAALVAKLAAEVERETGSAWHTHAGAHRLLRRAILALLARLKPEGPTFGEQPARTIPGNDLEEIGMWIEHNVWTLRDMAPDQRESMRRLQEETLRRIRERAQSEEDES